MLKLRILTALVLAPLIIYITLAVPHSGFAFMAALIFVIGSWEWAGLCGLNRSGRMGYAGLLAAVFAILYTMLSLRGDLLLPLLAGGLLWWLVALVQVLRFPAGSGFWHRSTIARGIAGVFVLVPAWAGIVALHAVDRYLALMVMVLVSCADIGAYFAGRAFGRHKLAPRVSPGKTWEGLLGALAVTSVVAWVAARLFVMPSEFLFNFVVLCLVTVLVSVLGDLAESMFKRMVGAKDSGGLLPGHGGVLDRIDSLTAAAPLFAAGILWLKVVA